MSAKEQNDFIFDDVEFRYNNGSWKIFQDDNVVREEEYDEISKIDNTERYYILKSKHNNLYSIIDVKFLHKSLFSSFKEVKYYRYDRILVETTYSKWGFITLQFNSSFNAEIIPCTFDAILERDDGLFNIKRDGGWGLMDIEGRILCPALFENCLRKDFLTFKGISVEETVTHGLKGLFKYENGNIKNLVAPIYSDIQLYENIYAPQGQTFSNFVFCSTDDLITVQSDGVHDIFVSRYEFIDCYTIGGKKLSPEYKFFYITDNGKYVFAGKDGILKWGYSNADYEYFKEFTGKYDMINDRGDIIINGLDDFFFYSLGEEGEKHILLVKFWEKWVIIVDEWMIIKKGLPSLKLNLPKIWGNNIKLTGLNKLLRIIRLYKIDINSKEIYETLIEYGLSEKDIREFGRWFKDHLDKNQVSDASECHDEYHGSYEIENYWNIENESYRDALDDDPEAMCNLD